jgi:hypothetical protein
LFTAKDWCHASTFDPSQPTNYEKMCCYGKVNDRPMDTERKSHKCCQFQAYSNIDWICCSGEVVVREKDPLLPDTPNNKYKCCGLTPFNSIRFMCCRGEVGERQSYIMFGADGDQSKDSCCGTVPFHMDVQFCRRGELEYYTK